MFVHGIAAWSQGDQVPQDDWCRSTRRRTVERLRLPVSPMHQCYVCLASTGRDGGVPPGSTVPPHPWEAWRATPALVIGAVCIEHANLPSGDSTPALGVHPRESWAMLVVARAKVRR